MDFTKKEIAATEVRLIAIVGSIILSMVILLKYLELSFSSLIGLVTSKQFVATDFAFVLVFSVILAASGFVFKSWKHKSTFIYVSESHCEVSPVDRRDEFLEIAPSYR